MKRFAAILGLITASAVAQGDDSFEKLVRPILGEQCIRCSGKQ